MTVSLAYIALFILGKCPGKMFGGIVRIPYGIIYVGPYIGIYIYILYKTGYCILKTDTPGGHPRKLNLMKLQVSQDTNVELSSEDEKDSDTEEENQDSSSSEDLEATTASKMQRTDPCI